MFFLETTSIRPRKFFILIPLLILATVIVPVVFFGSALKNLPGNTHFVLLIPVVFAVIFWFALNKVEVIMNNDGITYKTLFSTKEVLWNEVVSTYIRYQQHGKSGSHYWFFETSDRKLKFSSGYFSRKSLRLIAEAVVAKCTHADIQETIRKWAEGRFPWYIF